MITEQKFQIKCYSEGTLPITYLADARGLDISKTFDCGQCFRFEPVEGSRHAEEVSGVAYGKYVSFASDGGDLYIYNCTEEDFNSIWCRYLGLDLDYDAIKSDILSRSSSPDLGDAVSLGGGIHILAQQPWETVCSFIISQNNNIPRIKKIISALCRKYGERLIIPEMAAHGGAEAYTFPSPELLREAGVDAIFALKTGFRAKYIIDAAERVVDGRLPLSLISSLPTSEGAELLKEVKGIGDKVAACALLFGFGKLDAFPVDVWVKKIIAKYFGGELNPASLGKYAGVAQQYLFYFERWQGGND